MTRYVPVDRKRIALACSPHRVDALPLAVRRMRRYEAMILEEPEQGLFQAIRSLATEEAGEVVRGYRNPS